MKNEVTRSSWEKSTRNVGRAKKRPTKSIKRIHWFVLFLALSVCLAWGAGEEEKAATTMSDGPQHGGTLTWFTASQQPWLPQSWDNDTLYWLQAVYTEPYLDTLLESDMLARGPRGTNEFDYSGGYIPEDYLKGNLAESYTVTPEAITFKIRKGIMWHESPIMESRELTADDTAYSLNRRLEAFRAANPMRIEFIDEFTAPDKYTLVCKTNRYDADWTFSFAYTRFNVIQPPELNAPGVDPADWRSHVDIGTGAFLLQDYVEASYSTYDRNPNWWKSPQIIDGKEYDTPFVDTVVVPFIVDWSTFVSALRTGKIDWLSDLHVRYEDTLSSAHPDIQIKKVPRILTLFLNVRFDTPPLTDVNVRRALMIGTDIQAVVDAVYGGGITHGLPFGPGTGDLYTPIEDLPPSTKMLFDHNPELAGQMLADAGYPGGFELDCIYDIGMGVASDTVELLENMWGKLGVKLNLIGARGAAYTGTIGYPAVWKNVSTGGAIGNVSPFSALQSMGHPDSDWDDGYFKEQLTLTKTELDPVKRGAMLKDLAVYALDNVPMMGLGVPNVLQVWWPWLKNYYGEGWTGDYNSNYEPLWSTLWIDQAMKKDMGY